MIFLSLCIEVNGEEDWKVLRAELMEEESGRGGGKEWIGVEKEGRGKEGRVAVRE